MAANRITRFESTGFTVNEEHPVDIFLSEDIQIVFETTNNVADRVRERDIPAEQRLQNTEDRATVVGATTNTDHVAHPLGRTGGAGSHAAATDAAGATATSGSVTENGRRGRQGQRARGQAQNALLARWQRKQQQLSRSVHAKIRRNNFRIGELQMKLEHHIELQESLEAELNQINMLM